MTKTESARRQLKPCGPFPNCVCSRSDARPRHRVEPLAVTGDPFAAFARLKGLLEAAERTEIVSATDRRLHATCRTRMGFVDDLECLLCPEDGVIHVRSAARVGISDFGVNRARIERLRRQLQGA